MAVPVTMPELGESVTEGTVTRWLKDVGDSVAVDEPLLEVSTDKVDTEIPSPVAGTLLELVVSEDQTVEIGGLLAHIGDAGEATGADDHEKPAPQRVEPRPSAPAEPARQPGTAQQQDTPRPAPAEKSGPTPATSRQPAAPAQSEPRGEAPQRSVKPAADGGPQPGTEVPLSRLRKVIAQRMTESLTVSAQLTTVQEVDVTRIALLRQASKAAFERREGVKLTFLPFFAKAVVEALGSYPALNASISPDGSSVTYHQGVHLGIAVDTPRGLLVPVIRDAHTLGITGLARRIAELAGRTRDSTITPDELGGGTFTVTNIGSVGALFDTPIINQPQVAILATGAVYRRPAVVAGPDGEDQIGIRSFCYLPMTYDHRLVDGAEAGRFVSAVRGRLERGAFEAELPT